MQFESGTRYRERELAQGKENVVIAAGNCSATILPAFGGKIASLRAADHELIHAPLRPCKPRNPTMSFEESDAAGWDECLPSVAACSVPTPAGLANIPDHGDLWRVPWQVLEVSGDSVTMRARCFSLPLEMTRSMILAETSSGWRMQILYSLANLGTNRVPWSWAAHPLFSVDPGDRILLPESVKTVRVENSRGNRLGLKGSQIAWPTGNAPNISDPSRCLNVTRDAASEIADKLFTGSMQEEWCALERASIGLRITVRFDRTLTPYLGLWLCYGGWPESNPADNPDSPKQYCVALEPATAPADSLADTGEWSRWLDAGETATWPMELALDRIKIETPRAHRSERKMAEQEMVEQQWLNEKWLNSNEMRTAPNRIGAFLSATTGSLKSRN
jgi:galactose mutarotase-like enzyme